MRARWLTVSLLLLVACGGKVAAIDDPDPVPPINEFPRRNPLPAPPPEPRPTPVPTPEQVVLVVDAGPSTPPEPEPELTPPTKEPCPGGTTYYRDADGDGHGLDADYVKACEQPPGYVRTYDDCDDGDARAFPGQTGFFSTPRANGSFDFDCDGKAQKEHDDVDLQLCLCDMAHNHCGVSQAWKDSVPECGVSHEFSWEAASPSSCAIVYITKTQACR